MPCIRSGYRGRMTPRDAQPGLEGQGGIDGYQGREDVGRTGRQYDVYANQITRWKAQLIDGAGTVFGGASAGVEAASAMDLKTLHAKIGELAREDDFCPVRSARSAR